MARPSRTSTWLRNLRVVVTDHVKAAMKEARKFTALYVGGMGSKEQNFHKHAMGDRSLAVEADRTQEFYLAGRKDEEDAAIPEDYLDEGSLYGPPARIKERFLAWAMWVSPCCV